MCFGALRTEIVHRIYDYLGENGQKLLDFQVSIEIKPWNAYRTTTQKNKCERTESTHNASAHVKKFWQLKFWDSDKENSVESGLEKNLYFSSDFTEDTSLCFRYARLKFLSFWLVLLQ